MEQSQDAQSVIEPSVTNERRKFIPDEEYLEALEDFKTEFYKVKEKIQIIYVFQSCSQKRL